MGAAKKEKDRAFLKDIIEKRAFVRSANATIVSRKKKTSHWLMDLRAILMQSEVIESMGVLFWNTYKKKVPIQIGCIESAGIPLMTALVAEARQNGVAMCSGFFIRKSRKKDGLTKMVEGTVQKNVPIVLVDDLMNSGNSLIRQVEVVEGLGERVHSVWTLVRFRNTEYYQYFIDKGIEIFSVFELDDFSDTLGIKNFEKKEAPEQARQAFDVLWKFAAEGPSYQYVVPKSDPVLDDDRVYFGTDKGFFLALNQSDGSTSWSYKVGFHPKGKGIFSSPALLNGMVFFGAYDGNVYALDANTGAKRWVFFEADWVGSSPVIAADMGLVFIGLEFGLWKKHGGIVALDATSGARKWAYYEMPCLTHSTPLYIPEHQQVVIGSNDGAAYLFDGRNGELVWKFDTGTLDDRESDAGFSRYDIKESFAYDAARDCILFGNSFGHLYCIDRKTGSEVSRFNAEFGFYSTPVIYKDTLLASSLDKFLYCLELDTLSLRWKWNAGARIFATPVIINDSVYIGANTGKLTELDPESGSVRSQFTVTERITNRVAYSEKTGRYFLPTFANELYCLKKKPPAK